MLQQPEALNKDQVLFEFGKLEEEEEHKDKALAYYKELIHQHPSSPLSGETSIRIKSLEPPQAEEPSTNETEASPAEKSPELTEEK